MAACSNFAGLATVRFLLGVFEAGILPALLLVNSLWYTKREQLLRTALWYNTFAGIFGGILNFAVGKIDGPLSTWKYIFLIYGSVTMAAGILVFFALPDDPGHAWFSTKDEKDLARIRVSKTRAATRDKNREAIADPKYWCVAVFVIAQSITNAGITDFNPLIIADYGFSKSKTTLMATPQAGVAFVAQVVCTALAYFVPNIRCVLWTLSSPPALAGAIMIHMLNAASERDASLAGVYLMGFYNVPWVLMLSLQSSNTASATRKSFVSVSVAIFYAVGNIIGPQFFRSSQAPKYGLGIGAMLCCFAIMAATGVVYGDQRYGQSDSQIELDESLQVEDLTDFEVEKSFRYVY
ncbi:hypothetical protein KCU62_g8557, partial [Aureobasidium sp. EXF-3399]